ncbi:phage holin family protein [Cellulomonas sp. PhB150]|uniref:phage holin family protein n=1 Tax=Cellulomonas sp. PhB150 TaxID=2485188 RepID=UPI000F4A910E|nr:phage holin family protein [Cellulomonas sp. PhB150]ROS30803.1 superfamily IV 4 TMS phage holin [Cellulomonas sp. PhB150]
MINILIRAGIFLASAAIGLWVASLVVDGFDVSTSGFIVAVVVFAALQSILSPWIMVMTRRYAMALTGGVGLISTFVGLWIATLVSDGLTIDGVQAWVLGAVVVWIVTMLGTLLLPVVLIKKAVRQSRQL